MIGLKSVWRPSVVVIVVIVIVVVVRIFFVMRLHPLAETSLVDIIF